LLILLSGCGTTKFNVIEETFGSKVAGYVVDIANEEPIAGVDVMIGNTAFKTETTPQGYYEFQDVPPGSYQLYLRFGNGSLSNKQIRVRPDLQNETDFLVSNPVRLEFGLLDSREDTLQYLIERVRELEEKIREQEEKQFFSSNGAFTLDEDLKLFKEIFIGPSDQVKIINPEILEINRENGKLTVSADRLLEIENRLLGYNILLLIRDFELTRTSAGYRMDYDVIPFYREMATTYRPEQRMWLKNRKRAYESSFRHFLASLAASAADQEGFVLSSGYYRVQDIQIGSVYRGTESRTVDRSDIVTNLSDYAWRMELDGELSVLYEYGGAGRAYDFVGVKRYAARNSWLFLPEGPLVFTAGGNILDGEYQIAGYWKTTPVSEMLPAEYRPNAGLESFQP